MASFMTRTCARDVKRIFHSAAQLHAASVRGHIFLTPQRSLHHSRRILHILQKNPTLLWKNGKTPHLCGVLAVRHNGSVSQDAESLPAGYIPDKPPVPLPDPDLTSQVELNALGEPTLQSLGLGSNYPSGLFQQALDMLHVSLECNWWMAIVISTVFLRMCLFPLMIAARRNTTNMTNYMPQIQKLQERVQEAKLTGNQIELILAYEKLTKFQEKHDIKLSRMLLLPAVQMPVFVSVFWGMRGMALLPVESMKTGGLFWFMDLTVPDPFYILPLVTSATLLLTIELGVDSVQAKNMSHVQKWLFRVMPVIMFPVTMHFPAAMLTYWCTSNMFSLCQAMFLKIPAVRKACKIPDLIKQDKTKGKTQKPFIQGFKDSWEEQKQAARMRDRDRVEREKWARSGKGPLIKTYPYNPTERQQKVKTKV